MKRPLSKIQISFIILLWMALCFMMLVNVEKIDGLTITTILLSGAFVFIPVYQSLKKR
ncbi:MAG: hypothetical protein Q4D30_07155 [Bacteroidales bacterium]|nr:hypothetical protein [Bacteroidaceae bacterium]MDO4186247.1 hypothetical protein [Bacteroidales bacterium]MBR1940058.1 hypothetical protein [Bacteroidaceae bacterium]MBR3013710.1 hypothetical protein [Bacteroidaceae bacterium]MBR3627069.1 hypothetical protein [Bacteroidaceae bacterium]